MKSLAILTLTLTLAMLSAHPVAAQSGTQLTPDGKRALVSKDIAGQRWAISRNPDRTVTGNVFFPGGGAPQFVFCTETSASDAEVSLSCSGADACPLTVCEPDEWLFIADVTLPLSFFGNPAGGVARTAALEGGLAPVAAQAFIGISAADRATGASPEAQPSGIQITPNGAFALISKDVGDQRWAISRNDDGTVTGNVFFPGGGAPQFVWCEPTGTASDPVALRCLGAPACAVGEGGCASDDWTLIAEVSLPASFFRARDTVSLDALAASLNAKFGEQAAFERVALALDRGYSLRQIARAALSDRLQANGEIVERTGLVESPAGQPQGIFTGSAARTTGRPLGASITLQELIAKFGEEQTGNVILAVLLGLVERGYSMSLIVQELFFAGGGINTSPLQGGFELIDSSGDPIEPDGPPPRVGTPPLPAEEFCGNGVLDGPDDGPEEEECDGRDFFPGDTCASEVPGSFGELRCSSRCELDLSRCAKCGDGKITEGTEDCDGSNLAGQTCASQGSRGGTLRCNPIFCNFDLTGCDADCVAGGSGCCPADMKPCNGICVPNATVCCGPGTDVCNGACVPSGATCCAPGTQQCGSGCIPGGADCCGANGLFCEVGRICVDEGCCPAGFPVVCNDQCFPAGSGCCGNGIREAGEACDGADVGGATCPELGSVRCTPSCTLDTSGCESRCPPGAFTCGNSCAPNGAECCEGTSLFCDGGDVCAFGGGGAVCCPGSAPTFCAGTCYPAGVVCCGSYACAAGSTCLGNNQCG